VQINFGSRSVSCKIVYYGPGLSGKTTNIQRIHDLMPSGRKGELTSIKTDGDRTLFFDFMSLDLGKVGGMDTRFQIYTVPGQVFYNATRKLVLQGADGIVFVADSSPDRMSANVDSWQNLKDNLAERKLTVTDLPLVIQWNKRDVTDAVPPEEMNARVNDIGAATFEAVATEGTGVLDTLKAVCGQVCKQLNARAKKASASMGSTAAVTAAPEPERTVRTMQFVSRRRVATSDGSATAVSDPPKPPVVRDVAPAMSSAPVPPAVRTHRPLTSMSTTGLSRRSAWVSVLVVAGILAASVGLMYVLFELRPW